MIQTHLVAQARESYVNRRYAIECNLGDNPYGVAPSVVEALNNRSLCQAHQYHSFKEEHLLKDMLVTHFEASFSKKNIAFANGSLDALNMISSALLQKGTVLGIGPQFLEAVSLFKVHGHQYEFLDVSTEADESFIIHALCEKITHGKQNITALYIDNPNNPTGFCFSCEALSELVKVADERGIVTIIDEAYGDYLPLSHSFASYVQAFKYCLCVRSFSKAYGLASFRMGYVVCSDYITPYYDAIDLPYKVSFASILVAKAALQCRDHLEYVQEKTYRMKCDFIQRLQRQKISFLQTSAHVPIIFVKKAVGDSDNIFEKNDIRVSDGQLLSLFGGYCRDYCRVRLPDCSDYQEMLRRLAF